MISNEYGKRRVIKSPQRSTWLGVGRGRRANTLLPSTLIRAKGLAWALENSESRNPNPAEPQKAI